MREYTPEEVAALLERAGLAAAALDPEATAADLTERTELNDGLEPLLDAPGVEEDFTAFDPRWPA